MQSASPMCSRHARARLHPTAMPVILTTELLAGAAGAAAVFAISLRARTPHAVVIDQGE